MVIVAAVDGTDRAGGVVREADALARHVEMDLRIVHVLNRRLFMDLEQTSLEETGRPVEMSAIREQAVEIAASAAAGVTDDFEAVGLVGDPAAEIVEYADAEGAEFIVLGGRHRSPAGKVLFGSVAQQILLRADQPVVVAYSDTPETRERDGNAASG